MNWLIPSVRRRKPFLPAEILAGAMFHPLDQPDDRLHILVRFRRQADHEVKPHLHDIIFHQFFNRGKDLLFGDPLADHIPETLGAGLGGEGDGLHARFLEEAIISSLIRSMRREPTATFPPPLSRMERQRGRRAGMVRDGRTQKADRLPFFEAPPEGGLKRRGAPEPDGPADKAGGAETATPTDTPG